MCGIAGVIAPAPPDPVRVRAALDTMKRRGPDAEGVHHGRLGNHAVTLLHTRLSIIDLDPRANQPFLRAGLALSFNGEIYNYVEVRDALAARGHRFTTESDTEVLLEAYRAWGEDCFDRLEGMWACALLDEANGRLLLVRDRFGEKPLYYWPHEDSLYFASEVKTLAALAGAWPGVDRAQLRRYLVNGYKALYKRPATWFEGVRELAPAHLAAVVEPRTVEPRRYWTLAFAPQRLSLAEAEQGVRERLFEAVRLRLRADVPIAFCLSGGVDSSALAGIAAKHFGQALHAFSVVDSDPRYDERANMTATVDHLGCAHHVAHTRIDGFFERLARQVAYHDAPVATITYYMHAFLSEAIHAAGFKVAISGSAADELFTGYYDHYAFWLAEMSERPDFATLVADWRQSYGRHVRNPVLQDPLVFRKCPDERGHIYLNAPLFRDFLVEPFDEPFEERAYGENLLRSRMLNELFHECVPVILHEDDLNSMMVSVENRSPYLDRRLAEFLFNVPGEHLIRDGFAKYLLRRAVAGLVPDQVRLDKQKRGFNASIDSLIDRRDPATRERLLDRSPVFELVRRAEVERFLDRDMSDNSFSKFLFSFVSAKTFLDQHAA
jgi:asparagine synthase (glutamine-hydrolysing)